MENRTTRYSEVDFQAFQMAIEARLAKTNLQIEQLSAQLEDLYENNANGFDPDDNGSLEQEKEMLQTMLARQQKHSVDLQNALIRVKNKTYGVCEVTGQLIDKRRLLAVPTTTKSLMAKEQLQAAAGKQQATVVKTARKMSTTPVITSVIRRKATNPSEIDLFEDLDYKEDDWEDEQEETQEEEHGPILVEYQED